MNSPVLWFLSHPKAAERLCGEAEGDFSNEGLQSDCPFLFFFNQFFFLTTKQVIFVWKETPPQHYFPFCFLSPLLPLNTLPPQSKAVALGWWLHFGAVPEHPPLKAPPFAHHPRGKKLHENNAKTGIFCNILKDNLIFAHSATRATPTKAIINGSFDFVDPESCFEFQLFFFQSP